MLLVTTAIVLARRRIWYDSTLLVGLENLLVFVPFILISQAALIDQNVLNERRRRLAGANPGELVHHDLFGLDHLVFRLQKKIV